MTFIVNQSNLSLPDSESWKFWKLLVCSILICWWNSLRWKLQWSSAYDLLRAAVRSSYDSIMKSCSLIRLDSNDIVSVIVIIYVFLVSEIWCFLLPPSNLFSLSLLQSNNILQIFFYSGTYIHHIRYLILSWWSWFKVEMVNEAV